MLLTDGLDYLNEIQNINPKILDYIDKFIVNDKTQIQ